MITITYSFLIVSAVITAAVQIAKIFVPEKIFKFIPLGLFGICLVVYGIISRDVLNTLLNSVIITAVSVWFYDLIKPIINLFGKKKSE